jgi:transcriptional regulator with XRE-family HTH domain
MNSALGRFIGMRAEELGLSLSEVAKRAGKSRQTLHALSQAHARLPELQTLIDLALVLGVHPLRLIHLVFEDVKLPTKHERVHALRGDKSIFLADVTIPDGTVVLAGSTFTKTWEVQNMGTVAWEGRELRCMDEEVLITTRQGEEMRVSEGLRPAAMSIPVPFTPAGGVVTLSVDFTAPDLPCTCVSYWKSFFADGTPCFPESVGLTCKVRVLSMRAASLEGPAAERLFAVRAGSAVNR